MILGRERRRVLSEGPWSSSARAEAQVPLRTCWSVEQEAKSSAWASAMAITVHERPSTVAGLLQSQAGAVVSDWVPRGGMVTLPITETPLGKQPGSTLPAGGTKAR